MLNEQTIITKLASLVDTKFNIGLIVLTGTIFLVITSFPYNSNSNFDMVPAFIHYTIFLSGSCITASFTTRRVEGSSQVNATAIISFVLSGITLLLVKSYAMPRIGYFVFFPLNIFCSLLLIKNIWKAVIVAQLSKE
jgi:hypothetical protein